MTDNQTEKLSYVFNKLTDDQRKLDILNLPFNEFKNILSDREIISIELSDEIRNRTMFTGYSGTINLLRVSKGEVILKPSLIAELMH